MDGRRRQADGFADRPLRRHIVPLQDRQDFLIESIQGRFYRPAQNEAPTKQNCKTKPEIQRLFRLACNMFQQNNANEALMFLLNTNADYRQPLD
ncbi:MAG TPA: hypothetical protein VN284_19880, partial [Rhizobium sp.]|nr:hypothetical protein [Rhizobium sp.]